MNKKFLSVILFSALMVGTAGTFTSCKDYDDDIESLDNRVSAVEKLVSDLQAKIDAGSVITGVDKTEDGIVIKLSNGESYPIKNGTNGTNAPVWSIVKDANGDYWWAKDNVQTEFPARGEKVNRATVALVKTLKPSITTQVLKKLASCMAKQKLATG